MTHKRTGVWRGRNTSSHRRKVIKDTTIQLDVTLLSDYGPHANIRMRSTRFAPCLLCRQIPRYIYMYIVFTGLVILPGLQTVLKVGCLLTETTVFLCLWREGRYQSTSTPKMKGGFLWRVCCGRPSPTGWTSANIASLARRWRGRSGL